MAKANCFSIDGNGHASGYPGVALAGRENSPCDHVGNNNDGCSYRRAHLWHRSSPGNAPSVAHELHDRVCCCVYRPAPRRIASGFYLGSQRFRLTGQLVLRCAAITKCETYSSYCTFGLVQVGLAFVFYSLALVRFSFASLLNWSTGKAAPLCLGVG